MSGRVRVDLKVILRVGIVAGGLQELRTQAPISSYEAFSLKLKRCTAPPSREFRGSAGR